MASIFPSPGNGGVVTRDIYAVCYSPGGVSNVYCPPPSFTVGCDVTALPDNCSGRIAPSQINAIVSELLCFSASLSPNGAWACDSQCNLAANFATWGTYNKVIDNDTLTGSGTISDPWRVSCPASVPGYQDWGFVDDSIEDQICTLQPGGGGGGDGGTVNHDGDYTGSFLIGLNS